LRKLRFSGRKTTRGKSGAHRVCYVLFPEFGTIALAVVFGKNETTDLSAADRRAVAAVIQEYHHELEKEFGASGTKLEDQPAGGADG
jgi:hypothetical protein